MPNIAEITQMTNELAPDSLYTHLIEKFFANDQLINLLPFVPQGQKLFSGTGNWCVSVNFSDEPEMAVNRKIFQEIDAKINKTTNKIIKLREIANTYTTDRSLQRITSGSPVTDWEGYQLDMCVRSVVNKFNYDFINGVDSDDTNQFGGLMEYFKAYPKQAEDPITIPVLNQENAMEIDQFLDYCMSKIKGGANVILTTRLGGASFLRSLEGFRHRGIVPVTIGSKPYKTFLGIPIVELESNLFTPETLAKGIPIIFMRTDEDMDGVRVVIPSVGPLFDIISPTRDGNRGHVFTADGGVNMIAAPILVDPYCVSIAFINQTKGPGTGGGGNA